MRWFSAERRAALHRYAEQHLLVAHLDAEHREVARRLDEVSARRSRLEEDLRRYAGIDAAKERARLAELDGDIARQESAVAVLARRKERVDERLAPLLRDLHDREREADRLDDLLDTAEGFQRDLDYASNSYERKMIHLQCEDELGRSSPGAVIHDVRKKRNAVERDLEKLRRRIADEARRGARDIRAVVVDGNNLCFEDSRFIGLTALVPVCEALRRERDVTVVFDRSIETRWHLSHDRLAASLPGATVHVARSRDSADELILDAARDSYAVVLSNDRFGEFRDKDAVRDRRLVRHDILRGRVSVPDLDIDVSLVAPP